LLRAPTTKIFTHHIFIPTKAKKHRLKKQQLEISFVTKILQVNYPTSSSANEENSKCYRYARPQPKYSHIMLIPNEGEASPHKAASARNVLFAYDFPSHFGD
jgi:hypothetical protein